MEDKKKFNSLLDIARKHFEKKQYKNARLIYFQSLNYTVNPSEKAIVWAELCWIFYYEKKCKKAIEAAENVLLNDEDYGAKNDLYRIQGFCYLAINDIPMAERMLIMSLEDNSELPRQQYVKFELGKLYFTRGDYDLAFPYFEEVLPFFRADNEDYAKSTMFFLGFVNYYLNNYSKSRELFNEMLSGRMSDQQKTSAWFGLAFLEFQMKNYLNVISLCEKIIEADNNFFDKESIGFLTAASYFFLGRKDIFNIYFKQIMKKYPDGRYSKELKELSSQENMKDINPGKNT